MCSLPPIVRNFILVLQELRAAGIPVQGLPANHLPGAAETGVGAAPPTGECDQHQSYTLCLPYPLLIEIINPLQMCSPRPIPTSPTPSRRSTMRSIIRLSSAPPDRDRSPFPKPRPERTDSLGCCQRPSESSSRRVSTPYFLVHCSETSNAVETW